jgi:hypothetical protein
LPGPGNYERNDEFGKIAITFLIRGKSNERKGNDNPGPGNYNIDLSIIKDKVPAYKMSNSPGRSELVSKEQSFLPGPGNYEEHDEFGKNTITYSIRGKSNERKGNNNPGPGNYNADPSILKDKPVAYKIPSSPSR